MWADYDHVGAPLNPLRWSEKLTTRGALKSLGAFLEREAERHRPVLLGGAESVQLQGVEEGEVAMDEFERHCALARGADAAFVPERVIDDGEHAGHGVEAGEDVLEDFRIGPVGPEGEQAHPVGRVDDGEVVDAEVEKGRAVGDGPFDGDGRIDTEELELAAGVDRVVIGEGDDGEAPPGGEEAAARGVPRELRGRPRRLQLPRRPLRQRLRWRAHDLRPPLRR